MQRRTWITGFLAFSLTLMGTMAPAPASAWELIAERNVRLTTERDIIPIGGGRKFDAIKLKALRTGIEILNITIRLDSGRTINPPTRIFIPKDGESREIDIPGKRRITSITLIYKARSGSIERSLVQVYGKQ